MSDKEISGIDSDLIRGHIDTIILKVLFEGDRYGIEICKEVEEKSNGLYELKQPTLYSCLKRLESQGLISSYWEDSDIGGKRHYYKLTDEGKETYKHNQEEWLRSRQIIDNLISNSTADASSYALIKKEEIEDLAKKAELAEKLEDEQLPSFATFEDEEAIIPWSYGVTEEKAPEFAVQDTKDEQPAKKPSNQEDEALSDVFYSWSEAPDDENVIIKVSSNGEMSSAIVSQPTTFASNDLPFDEEKDTEVSKAQASFFEEQSPAPFSQPEENLEEDELAIANEENPDEPLDKVYDAEETEEEPVETAIAEETEEEPVETTNEEETTEELSDDVDILELLGHNVRSEIAYEPKLGLKENQENESQKEEEVKDETLVEDEEITPFNFSMEDFVMKSQSSYFESEDINKPKTDYIAPEMKIDGLEEKASENATEEESQSEAEKDEIYEPNLSTPVYHDFGANEFINKKETEEDEIWVDESQVDPDQIYLNPETEEPKEAEKQEETYGEPEELSLFEDDILEDNSENNNTYEKPEEDKQFEPYNEIIRANVNPTPMDFYKTTENYDNLSPQYTEEEYKEKLSSLMTYGNNSQEPENNDVYSFNKAPKDYSELKADFEKEGLVVKPHHKMVKEAKDTRSYIESNKLNLVNSWTAFGVVSFLITVIFLIMNNYKESYTSFDFSYKYFLIGIAVLLIVPVIYTLIYFINPYKKKPARYASRIYLLFAILLTVQLFIIIYCVNLQLGFYSFSQENYNHLLWVVPCIMALYPLADAILHTVYFNSKNFHV